MDTVECKEVIITSLLRRGIGTADNPIRIITQIWEKDGRLIAEIDPAICEFTEGDLCVFDLLRSSRNMIRQRDDIIHELTQERKRLMTMIPAAV